MVQATQKFRGRKRYGELALNMESDHPIVKHLCRALGDHIGDAVNAGEDRDMAKMLGNKGPSVLWRGSPERKALGQSLSWLVSGDD